MSASVSSFADSLRHGDDSGFLPRVYEEDEDDLVDTASTGSLEALLESLKLQAAASDLTSPTTVLPVSSPAPVKGSSQSAHLRSLKQPKLTALDFSPRLQTKQLPAIVKTDLSPEATEPIEALLSPVQHVPTDPLDFQPRLQAGDTTLDELTSLVASPPAAAVTPDNNNNDNASVTRSVCFEKVQLVSPEFFAQADAQNRLPIVTINTATAAAAVPDDDMSVVSSPLANMVHPMNLDLFIVRDKDKRKKNRLNAAATAADDVSDCSSMSSVSMASRCSMRSVSSQARQRSSRVFRLDKYRQKRQQSSSSASVTSQSSFLSSCSTMSRISYSLKSGSKGMSRQERREGRQLLKEQKLAKQQKLDEAQRVKEQEQATSLAAAVVQEADKENRRPTAPPSAVTSKAAKHALQSRSLEPSKSPKKVSKNVDQSVDKTAASKERKDKVPKFIFVLLVEPAQKIFEVVKIDPTANQEGQTTTRNRPKPSEAPVAPIPFTVGDVLAQARAGATDPALATQKYASLCNGQQELAAPMLPVELLLLLAKSPSSSSSKRKSPQMLLAVPDGSTAAVVRQIHDRLMQNPRMQRWWKQQDPFDAASKKKSSSSGASVSSHKSSSSRRRSSRSGSHRTTTL